jgi:circadian clock protein KaiC
VFLHKIKDPQVAREKTFQLASIVQNNHAVGLFATDIPYGTNQISRFGVEETVVDGVILLSATQEVMERQRYLEVYKLRNTAHLKGRHSLVIGKGGVTIFPRYNQEELQEPPALEVGNRLPSGIWGLDELCGGGLAERSVTLVSGSAGVGKTTFGLQFIAEGLKHKEPGLYVSLEEGSSQIIKTASGLGLPLKEAIHKGSCEVLYLSREQVRASQFLAILADKIKAKKIRRLVLDGVSHVLGDEKLSDDLRQLLFALVARFKILGVTSILTLESNTMYATGTITDHGFSRIADNIVLLRYLRSSPEDQPILAVVKTRGSAHDRGTRHFTIGKGGIRVGDRVDGALALTNKKRRLEKHAN